MWRTQRRSASRRGSGRPPGARSSGRSSNDAVLRILRTTVAYPWRTCTRPHASRRWSASRTLERFTPKRSASSRSEGSASLSRTSPVRIAARMAWATCSEIFCFLTGVKGMACSTYPLARWSDQLKHLMPSLLCQALLCDLGAVPAHGLRTNLGRNEPNPLESQGQSAYMTHF